jgi:hypothetical protein
MQRARVGCEGTIPEVEMPVDWTFQVYHCKHTHITASLDYEHALTLIVVIGVGVAGAEPSTCWGCGSGPAQLRVAGSSPAILHIQAHAVDLGLFRHAGARPFETASSRVTRATDTPSKTALRCATHMGSAASVQSSATTSTRTPLSWLRLICCPRDITCRTLASVNVLLQ